MTDSSTEFDVAGSPFKGRDIIDELSKACKKYGVRFGLYYSIIDWNHPSQKPGMKGSRPFKRSGQTLRQDGKKEEYITYQTSQILELIKKYDPAVLWFDGDWVDRWTLDDGIRLYNTIREASPDIIVNNRIAKRKQLELDYVTQEKKHFEGGFPKHWEGCYTMNKSWGYKKHDQNWKNPQTIYDKLKDINSKEGLVSWRIRIKKRV